MGLLGRLASNEPRFRDLERPEIGKVPTYGSLTGRPDNNTAILQRNIAVVSSDIAGQLIASAAMMHARFFLENQGIDLEDDANSSYIQSIDASAQLGALLAEIENRARYQRVGMIEFEHGKLYSLCRAELLRNEEANRDHLGFVYDVSYYVTRSNTDFEEFFGPAPNLD